MRRVMCNAAAQVPNAARLARAKGYPYARPSSSFLYLSGAPFTFDDAAWKGAQHVEELAVTSPTGERIRAADAIQQLGITWNPEDERLPVLAIGSNAGPEQLLRKYPPDMFPDGVVIPCVRCMLRDFDVAFAPLISSYGSCTATLEHSPGTTVETFVTYLTAAQLKRMHETEGAYFLNELRKLDLHVGLGLEAFRKGGKAVEVLHTVYQYNHQSGTLYLPLHSGPSSPVAIKLGVKHGDVAQAIRAHKRRFPELDQVQMQRAVCAFVSTGGDAISSTGTALSKNGAQKAKVVPSHSDGQDGLQAAPHMQADSQQHAEGTPDQATTAIVHNMAEHADQHADAQPDSSASSSLLHSGSEIADHALEEWMLENLDDPSVRSKRVDALTAAAMPIQYSHAEVLMTIGNIYDRNVD